MSADNSQYVLNEGPVESGSRARGSVNSAGPSFASIYGKLIGESVEAELVNASWLIWWLIRWQFFAHLFVAGFCGSDRGSDASFLHMAGPLGDSHSSISCAG